MKRLAKNTKITSLFGYALSELKHLRQIETEYDIATRFELKSTEDLFVIHSSWREAFSTS